VAVGQLSEAEKQHQDYLMLTTQSLCGCDRWLHPLTCSLSKNAPLLHTSTQCGPPNVVQECTTPPHVHPVWSTQRGPRMHHSSTRPPSVVHPTWSKNAPLLHTSTQRPGMSLHVTSLPDLLTHYYRKCQTLGTRLCGTQLLYYPDSKTPESNQLLAEAVVQWLR